MDKPGYSQPPRAADIQFSEVRWEPICSVKDEVFYNGNHEKKPKGSGKKKGKKQYFPLDDLTNVLESCTSLPEGLGEKQKEKTTLPVDDDSPSPALLEHISMLKKFAADAIKREEENRKEVERLKQEEKILPPPKTFVARENYIPTLIFRQRKGSSKNK